MPEKVEAFAQSQSVEPFQTYTRRAWIHCQTTDWPMLRTCTIDSMLFLDDVQNLNIHAVRAKILMSFFLMNI